MSTMKYLPGFEPRNLTILHDKNGSGKIVAYDSTYMGRELFSIAQIFQRRNSDVWEPGKGVNVPLDQKKAFLNSLRNYLTTQE